MNGWDTGVDQVELDRTTCQSMVQRPTTGLDKHHWVKWMAKY